MGDTRHPLFVESEATLLADAKEITTEVFGESSLIN